MKFPCSYLVYSKSFQRLPEEALQEVYRQMREVLEGTNTDRAYSHLTIADRTAIREILDETVPSWAAFVSSTSDAIAQ